MMGKVEEASRMVTSHKCQDLICPLAEINQNRNSRKSILDNKAQRAMCQIDRKSTQI